MRRARCCSCALRRSRSPAAARSREVRERRRRASSGEQAARERPTPRRRPTSEARGLRIATARIVFDHPRPGLGPVLDDRQEAGSTTPRARPASPSPTARRTASRSRACAGCIDEAIADQPDGLVVSLPDVEALRAVDPARRSQAGIPVITINSRQRRVPRRSACSPTSASPSTRRASRAGERMAARGRRARAVRQPGGGQRRPRRALPRLRATACAARAGTSRALLGAAPGSGDRRSGGWRQAVTRRRRSTGSSRSARAAPGRRSTPCARAASDGASQLATFDLSPDVLDAVRDGEMLFAVDQQPYLQGYLPVDPAGRAARATRSSRRAAS